MQSMSMKFLQFTEANRRDSWGYITYCTKFQWSFYKIFWIFQFTEASRRDSWGSPLYLIYLYWIPMNRSSFAGKEIYYIIVRDIDYWCCSQEKTTMRERIIYHSSGYCLLMLFPRTDNGWFITQTKPIYYCWTTFWLKAFLGETLIMSSVLTHIKHCSQKCNLNHNI